MLNWWYITLPVGFKWFNHVRTRQEVGSLGVGGKFVKLVALQTVCAKKGPGGWGAVKMRQSCRTRVKETAIKDTKKRDKKERVKWNKEVFKVAFPRRIAACQLETTLH